MVLPNHAFAASAEERLLGKAAIVLVLLLLWWLGSISFRWVKKKLLTPKPSTTEKEIEKYQRDKSGVDALVDALPLFVWVLATALLVWKFEFYFIFAIGLAILPSFIVWQIQESWREARRPEKTLNSNELRTYYRRKAEVDSAPQKPKFIVNKAYLEHLQKQGTSKAAMFAVQATSWWVELSLICHAIGFTYLYVDPIMYDGFSVLLGLGLYLCLGAITFPMYGLLPLALGKQMLTGHPIEVIMQLNSWALFLFCLWKFIIHPLYVSHRLWDKTKD